MKILRLSVEQESPRAVPDSASAAAPVLHPMEQVSDLPPQQQQRLANPNRHELLLLPSTSKQPRRQQVQSDQLPPALPSSLDPFEQAILSWQQAGVKPAEWEVRQRLGQQLMAHRVDSSSSPCIDWTGERLLTRLPDMLKIEGDLLLDDCVNLRCLPDRLLVTGKLSLRGCNSLHHIDSDLQIDGDLCVAQCASLRSLRVPVLSKHLDASQCPALTRLIGQKLDVRGNCDLSDCTALVHLPITIEVGGKLDLSHCSSLTKVAEQLKVGRSLLLRKCSQLQSVAQKLTIGGSLYAGYCPLLACLCAHGKVDGELVVRGCVALVALPADCDIGRNIDVRQCTQLTTLPAKLLLTGSLAHGRRRMIYVEGSGIPAEQLHAWTSWRIFHQTEDCSRVLLNRSASSRLHFSTLTQAWRYWRRQAPYPFDEEMSAEPAVLPIKHLSPAQQLTCIAFLERLIRTSEYEQLDTRLALHRRCYAILQVLAHINESDKLLAMMEQAIHGDDEEEQWLYQLHQMELYLAVTKAEQAYNNADVVRTFGKMLYGWQLLDRWIMSKSPFVGEGSGLSGEAFYLNCAVHLAPKLGLTAPVSQQMVFAEDSWQELKEDLSLPATGDTLRRQFASESGFEAFLNDWSAWHKHQRYMQIRRRRWRRLPEAPFLPEYVDRSCVLTLQPYHQLKQPVIFVGSGSSVIMEWSNFQKWWIASPFNPYRLQHRIDLSDMQRLPPGL